MELDDRGTACALVQAIDVLGHQLPNAPAASSCANARCAGSAGRGPRRATPPCFAPNSAAESMDCAGNPAIARAASASTVRCRHGSRGFPSPCLSPRRTRRITDRVAGRKRRDRPRTLAVTVAAWLQADPTVRNVRVDPTCPGPSDREICRTPRCKVDR
jgi:hypothetical protein